MDITIVLLISAAVFVSLDMAIRFYSLGAKVRYREKSDGKEDRRFIQTVENGIKDQTIKDLTDIENVYKGVFESHSDYDKQRQTSLLRKLLVQLQNGESLGSGVSSVDKKQAIELLSGFIAEAERIDPYADIPLRERNILKDIEYYLQEPNIQGLESKMKEMVTSIRAKEDVLNRLSRQKIRSDVISILSIGITAASIVYAVLT